MSTVDHAIAYARRGWGVFPVSPISKRPWTKNGYEDAATDETTIRRLFENSPTAMIGIAAGETAGFFVLDLDAGEDDETGEIYDVEDVRAAVEDAIGEPLPPTYTVSTPGSGQHLYFRTPSGTRIKNRIGIIARVDVRAGGGYVVAPPSRRADGKAYELINNGPLAEPSERLIHFVTSRPNASPDNGPPRAAGPIDPIHRRYANAALSDEEEKVRTASEGCRNHTLNIAALKLGHLVGAGLLSEAIVRAVLTAAASGLAADDGDKSVENTITSGLNEGREEPTDTSTIGTHARKGGNGTHDPGGDSGAADQTAEPGAEQDDAKTKSSKPSGKDFQWVTAKTVKPVLNGNWLIKGIVPLHGLGVIYGKPGRGKSVLTTDIALHIAGGIPWRGATTGQAGVSYLGSEAGRLGANRVLAWCQHHARPWPEKFRLSTLTLDLRSNQSDALALAADIKANQPDCGLIVIDTLARNLAGGNENASEDMGAYIANVALLEQQTGAFVLSVHHCGKDEARGSRGHSSLLGAIDFEAELKREQGEPGIMRISKLRDGQDGAEYGFDISAVEMGVDEDGELVTAPIAINAGIDEAKAACNREPQGKNQTTVYRAFEMYVDDHGKPTPIGTGFPEPGAVKAVDDAAFQNFAAGKMGHPEAWRRLRAVKDALDAMIERRMYCRNGGLLWKL